MGNQTFSSGSAHSVVLIHVMCKTVRTKKESQCHIMRPKIGLEESVLSKLYYECKKNLTPCKVLQSKAYWANTQGNAEMKL